MTKYDLRNIEYIPEGTDTRFISQKVIRVSAPSIEAPQRKKYPFCLLLWLWHIHIHLPSRPLGVSINWRASLGAQIAWSKPGGRAGWVQIGPVGMGRGKYDSMG